MHGEFLQKPPIHISGSGCPRCSESKGERKINSFLAKENISFKRQKTFNDCVNNKTGRLLSFDFYLPKYNLCIEYDGEYHYEPWRLYFDKSEAQEKYNDLKYRDNLKNLYVKNNNIKLLRIPYFEFKNIDKIISSYLFKKH